MATTKKTTTKKTETKKTETKKTETKKLEQVFALWKNKSKSGKTFLSNKLFIGFYNTHKKNPKEPDMRIYLKDEEGKIAKDEEGNDIQVCALWSNVSESGKKYLSGKYEGEKVVGFINNSDNEKAPYISVYLRKTTDEPEQLKIEADKPEFVPVDDSDPEELPF